MQRFVRPLTTGSLFLLIFLTAPCARAQTETALFTRQGSDPTWAEVLDAGNLDPLYRPTTRGVTGSTIRVNQTLWQGQPWASRALPNNLRLHTVGNSYLSPAFFARWSRWYQTDNTTQIFRLFADETNVQNTRDLAARVETFVPITFNRCSVWHEWTAVVTLAQAHDAAIFQSKNSVDKWSVQITMTSEGDLIMERRRAANTVLDTNVVGRPFTLQVRDNGCEYQVYYNGVYKGFGYWARPTGTNQFRWGMYMEANDVEHDAMVLIAGARSTVLGRV